MNNTVRNAALTLMAVSMLGLAACASSEENADAPAAEPAPASSEPAPMDSTTTPPPADASTPPPADATPPPAGTP